MAQEGAEKPLQRQNKYVFVGEGWLMPEPFTQMWYPYWGQSYSEVKMYKSGDDNEDEDDMEDVSFIREEVATQKEIIIARDQVCDWYKFDIDFEFLKMRP